MRARQETKQEAAAVYERHGSRKRPDGGGAATSPPSKRQATGGSGSAADASALSPSTDVEAAAARGGSSSDGGAVVVGGGVAAADAPFSVETAPSGRAACKSCGGAIAKGSAKAVVTAWARGGKVKLSHHLSCWVGGLRVEACAASRGKCKHSAAPFVRGTPRVGYPAASADERNWLCLPSAAALLPAATARIREPPAAEWAPRQMGGFDALSAELRAEVEGEFSVAA